MGAPGVDRKVISGLCCVDRMKASVVRPDGVGDGALGDPRDKRRGPCYSALGALQEVVISHDIFSADHHAEVARSRAGISAFSPCPVKSQFGYTAYTKAAASIARRSAGLQQEGVESGLNAER